MNQQTPSPPVYWIIWGMITAVFFISIGIFESSVSLPNTPPWMALAALPPLIASAVIRFGLLPRVAEARKNFIFFILGLVLAESGGFIALMFGSPWKTPLAAVAIVLMLVHVPAFIRRS